MGRFGAGEMYGHVDDGTDATGGSCPGQTELETLHGEVNINQS